ncbi:uncharacterized protein PHALS_08223 [Plasmopara halstedii]|uniref:Uncharacterized protein n=1 Tax=Plasmopara halstedii TaxID=4781 RepID=A0A0P1AC67_PLAHL|nr:uncharacterized protein PHALS_08223 [Plasmopara halstedii]CEG38132.1 hypothetical protein PHALS_08223 [Plasmopara halstedii]|eukprot:XP_024574501.1 hypothetical protein PHALS_08223 [Plasmopara halstedii]
MMLSLINGHCRSPSGRPAAGGVTVSPTRSYAGSCTAGDQKLSFLPQCRVGLS